MSTTIEKRVYPIDGQSGSFEESHLWDFIQGVSLIYSQLPKEEQKTSFVRGVQHISIWTEHALTPLEEAEAQKSAAIEKLRSADVTNMTAEQLDNLRKEILRTLGDKFV